VTISYRIYGLNLSSDFPIPGLHADPDGARVPDVCVELNGEPRWVQAALRLPAEILHRIAACPETQDPAFVLTGFGEGQFFQLAYSDGTRFVVDRAATHIWGMAGESQTMEDLSTYLLGPIMGFVLRRRGTTALHASAFSIDGKTIALAGPAGSGKSTTAGALALRGASAVCEDIAALEQKDGGFKIALGYPRICLWPDSVELLMGSPDALPRITPSWGKCYLPLDGAPASLETQSRPLRAIYILAPREAASGVPRIDEVSGQEMLLDLVQNTYMNWLLDRRQRAAEFEMLSRLVEHVPVRRVVPHSDPSRIHELCDLIIADARLLNVNRMAAARAAGG
jgi:hypothetical protein